jgi:acetylornithine deacetylase
MKGGLVSGLWAVAALKRIGVSPRGELLLESVIGEETGGVGTLATVVRGYRADAAIVLEPTRMAICPVGAGAASFRLRVPGRAAHGAMRGKGVSAVEKFIPLYAAMEELERSRHAGFRHPCFETGDRVAALSVGKVRAGDWVSTVPESLVAEGRYGILPGETLQAARAQFEAAVGKAAGADPWLREHPPAVEWFEGQFEPAETSLEAPFLAALSSAHRAVAGAAAPLRGVPYGSDLRFFTNHAGMPAVLYGPGDVAWAHSVDEHVPVEQVVGVARTVALAILDWCGMD